MRQFALDLVLLKGQCQKWQGFKVVVEVLLLSVAGNVHNLRLCQQLQQVSQLLRHLRPYALDLPFFPEPRPAQVQIGGKELPIVRRKTIRRA